MAPRQGGAYLYQEQCPCHKTCKTRAHLTHQKIYHRKISKYLHHYKQLCFNLMNSSLSTSLSTDVKNMITKFLHHVFSSCKKGELFDYLTEVVTLSEKRTRQVMRQLLEAVDYVHSRNIVHRDLKPENILLDDCFNVKLSDFGFASVISHEEELTELYGTPGYLAPEVLKVSMDDDAPGYGRPCDMWACGVIMFTLLVGCPPFWHRKQLYMLRAIMEGKYSMSSPEWEDISEHPKDLVSKLLVVDVKERYTVQQALAHPFFKREEVSADVHGSVLIPSVPDKREEEIQFFPRRKFRAGVLVVMAINRIRHLHLHPPPIGLDQVRKDPYSIKAFRKVIDAGAFKIYGHWVKRGENQNRAALFESSPKRDIKASESDVKEDNMSVKDTKFLILPGLKPNISKSPSGRILSKTGIARRIGLTGK